MTSGRRLEALMDAMSDTALTPTQRYVVLCLARYADHKTGRNARPGLRTIATEARCKVETAQNALARAEEFGIVAAAHRAPGRATTWTVLPEPSPETGHQVSPQSGHGCPPTVPPLSRNGDTTTETTGLYGTPPREETPPSTHTPTTHEGGSGEKGTPTAAAQEFAADLLRHAVAGTPTADDRRTAAQIAAYVTATANVDWITGLTYFQHAKDKRLPGMLTHAAAILADALKNNPEPFHRVVARQEALREQEATR